MRIGLAQINYRSYSYLPYSVGALQAYVEQHATAPEQFEFLPPLYRPMPIEAAIAQLNGADVVAFSTYVWNVRISLAIAEELKRVKPATILVFGGPQVPDQAEGCSESVST